MERRWDEALVAAAGGVPGAPVAEPLSRAWILPRGEVAYALVVSDKVEAAWLLRGTRRIDWGSRRRS